MRATVSLSLHKSAYACGGANQFSPSSKDFYSKGSSSKSTTTIKDTPKEQSKKEGKQPVNAFTPSGQDA